MGLFDMFGSGTGGKMSNEEKERIIEKAENLIKKEKYAAAWDTLTGNGKFVFHDTFYNYKWDWVFHLMLECEEFMTSQQYDARYRKADKQAIIDSVNKFYDHCFKEREKEKRVKEYIKKSEENKQPAQQYFSQRIAAALGTEEIPPELKELEKAAQNDTEAMYQLGCECYSREYYKKGIECFKKAADKNHYHGLLQCVEMTDLGEMELDKKAFIGWLEALAAHNDAAPAEKMETAFRCARMYHNGNGVEKNLEKAVHWYRIAAENGNKEAMYILGCLYTSEDAIFDTNAAYCWMIKAAKLDHTEAMKACAEMYLEGKGVEKDEEQYIYWMEKAAEMDDADAMFKVAEYCMDTDKLTEEKIKKVMYYAKKACSKGHAQANVFIGIFAENNDCYDEALGYYKIAAEKNNASGLFSCIKLYETGKVENEPLLKIRYMEKLLQHSDVDDTVRGEIQFTYANILYKGEETEKDIQKAISLYEKAAQNGEKMALYNLGLIYMYDEEVKDEKKGLYWLEKAADMGDIDAMAECSKTYYKKENYANALKWSKKAADMGDIASMGLCGLYYYTGAGTVMDREKAGEYFRKVKQSGEQEYIEVIENLEKKEGVVF